MPGGKPKTELFKAIVYNKIHVPLKSKEPIHTITDALKTMFVDITKSSSSDHCYGNPPGLSLIQLLEDQIKKLDGIDKRVKCVETENQSLKAENQSLKTEIQSLKTENQLLKTKIQSLKTENQLLKTEIQSLKTENQLLKTEIQSLKTKIQSLKTENESSKEDMSRDCFSSVMRKFQMDIIQYRLYELEVLGANGITGRETADRNETIHGGFIELDANAIDKSREIKSDRYASLNFGFERKYGITTFEFEFTYKNAPPMIIDTLNKRASLNVMKHWKKAEDSRSSLLRDCDQIINEWNSDPRGSDLVWLYEAFKAAYERRLNKISEGVEST